MPAATGATLLAGLGLGLAIPGASASEVCGGLDSGKIDVSGEQSSVTITAETDELISGYCVKAGSAESGGGPVYVELAEPQQTVVITHPTMGSVSHYSYSVVSVESETTTTSTSTSTTPTDTGSTTPTDTGSTTPTDTGSTTPTGTSTTTPSGTTTTEPGNPNENCPAGTTVVAKFNLVNGVYVAEFGGDLVTVVGDADGGTFVTADGVVITAVLVKGGTTVVVDVDGNLSFDNDGLVNDGGQVAAISNVQFCGPTTPTDTGSTTPTDTGSTTPTDTGSTTPTDTGSTTPTDTGSTTPTDTGSTTPTDTGSTTPTDTGSTTPTDTGSTTPTDTGSTTPTDTGTTTPAGTVTATVTATPGASVAPTVLGAGNTGNGGAVLARTGVETTTVALVAGLMLASGGALVALGNSRASAGNGTSGRRH